MLELTGAGEVTTLGDPEELQEHGTDSGLLSPLSLLVQLLLGILINEHVAALFADVDPIAVGPLKPVNAAS